MKPQAKTGLPPANWGQTPDHALGDIPDDDSDVEDWVEDAGEPASDDAPAEDSDD